MNLIIEIKDSKVKFVTDLLAKYSFVKKITPVYDKANSDKDYKIPEWQITEVKERMEEYNRNPSIGLDFDSVMDEIEKNL